MVARISSEVRGAIKVHVQNGLSSRTIVACLTELEMVVSKSTIIINVMQEITEEKAGIVKQPRKWGTQNQRSAKRKESRGTFIAPILQPFDNLPRSMGSQTT
jgi:hypothetical protein